MENSRVGNFSEINFFWNSGVFIFKAATFLDELNDKNEKIFSATENSLKKANSDLDFIRLDKDSFSQNPNISIDYAVMEKTSKGKVVPLNAGWSDVGSWNSLWEVSDKDSDGNAIRGSAVLSDVKNSYIYSR